MTHLAGGQECVLQGGGHGDPAVRGEARVQSSEQSDWAHEATPTPHTPTLRLSLCHLAIKFTDCCKVCTGTGTHPGPGPGLLTPSHCNVSAAQTNTMKVVPLSQAEHCEHERVLRLWTSDLCGGSGRVQLVMVAGRALNNQVSCCAWHRCIQPHCWSLSLPLVTECQTAAAALQPRNRGNQGDVAQLCVMQRWKRIFAKFEVSQSQRKTLLRPSPPQSSHFQQAEGPSRGLLHE